MNAMQRIEPKPHSRAVLELEVANHPGVMSHVVGAFSRRLFNVEGIVCLPVGNGEVSRIWLLVKEDQRLPQLIRQLEKLEDVNSVRHQSSTTAFHGVQWLPQLLQSCRTAT
jgi:acetolactate synthase I/III small subunit